METSSWQCIYPLPGNSRKRGLKRPAMSKINNLFVLDNVSNRQPCYEKRAVGYGLEVCTIESAELFAAFRATLHPEYVVTVAVFGVFSADPLAAAAFEAVEKGPLVSLQSFGAI